MAIAYVGGAGGGTSTAVSSFTLSYTSTAGNALFVSLGTNGTLTSVTDSAGNTWTVGGGTDAYGAWVLSAAAVTSVTTHTSGPVAHSICVAEYSGMNGGEIGSASATGTASPAVVSKNITGGHWLIATLDAELIGSAFTISSNQGNLRQTGTQVTISGDRYQGAIIDNTSATNASVAVAVTFNAMMTYWGLDAYEFAPSPASSSGHLLACLGGGG